MVLHLIDLLPLIHLNDLQAIVLFWSILSTSYTPMTRFRIFPVACKPILLREPMNKKANTSAYREERIAHARTEREENCDAKRK